MSSQPADETGRELGTRSRAVAAVVWCAFIAAAVATMVCFAYVDPDALRTGDAPAWWTDRPTIYAIGFFFFWMTAAVASILTVYLVHTDRPRRKASGNQE